VLTVLLVLPVLPCAPWGCRGQIGEDGDENNLRGNIAVTQIHHETPVAGSTDRYETNSPL